MANELIYLTDATHYDTINAPTQAGSKFKVVRNTLGAFAYETESEAIIMVTDKTHFGTIDSSKIYLIGGVVDMGDTVLEVPAAGINIVGYTFDVSQLISSEDNYTMFTSPVGGSGNVLIENCGLTTSGASSKLLDLVDATGFNAVEFNIVNFNNCTSLGVIDGYRQGLEKGTGRFGGTPELELKGNWVGGYFIDTSIIRSLTDGAYTLYKAGTGFSMASRFRSNQNIDLPASASLLDFAPSNFPNAGTLQLNGMELTRDGVYKAGDTNLTPNVNKKDLCSYWKQNNGLQNTFVGGTITVTSEELTTIGAGSTWYTLEGIFTGTGLEHFTASADGKLTHNGNSPREFEMSADLILDSNPNNELEVRWNKWDDSLGVFSPLEYTERVRQVNSLVGGRDVAFFTLIFGCILDAGDYIQLQVKNNSGNSDITMENGSFFRVQER